MRQILQNLRSGATELADIPCPSAGRGNLLIASRRTLVSAGTERMLLQFGRANMIDKARQQPEKVRMVLEKARTDGIAATLDAVCSRLDQPLPLGYCNAGMVLDVGTGVTGFAIGDRVVSNGAHAEIVRVPHTLCAKIPDGVDDDAAAFSVIGAIALQGIRLAAPTLGESFVVTGLGLVGLLAVQLLHANGCRVLGIDMVKHRLRLAESFGAQTVDLSKGEDPISRATAFSRGRGVDGVLITASTRSSEPVHQAAVMCRKRGRIVLVGVTGLELSRDDFYQKELTFQVSCSYGPGRYDPGYEERGQDYPFGFVRWTEQRNFEAVLDMLADNRLSVSPLITHHFELDQATAAYDALARDGAALGIVLHYPEQTTGRSACVALPRESRAMPSAAPTPGTAVCGFLGAGNYASRVLIPAFREAGAALHTVVSSGGVSAVHHGRKSGFRNAATNPKAVLEAEDVDTMVIATRHDSHADYAAAALHQGKHVFVEKPLALNHDELNRVAAAWREARASGRSPLLMVGFNRRFAPHVVRMKSLLAARTEPKSFIVTVNAGEIPAEHWTQDAAVGGGRILGEGCHFIDLLRFLTGSPITAVQTFMMGAAPGLAVRDDKAAITLGFADGSFGTIHYLANGDKGFPKERIEVFCGGGILQLDNFRRLTGYGWPGFSSMRLWRQDKGQAACARAFVEAVKTGADAPISFDELIEVSRVSIDAALQLHAAPAEAAGAVL